MAPSQQKVPTLNLVDSNLPKPPYMPEFGQVMTDEQVETLRWQLAAYSTISEQLAKMYQDLVPTLNLVDSNLPKPPYMPEFGQGMTDEQVETLRSQIGDYLTITKQLVKMYEDSLKSSQAATRRWTRWRPSVRQIGILENLYDGQQRGGAPRTRSLAQVTEELSAHGPVTEQNVKIWFQNRKARAKRNQRAR